ncbi:MAG TPA: energy-coupling factor transporter transmembrane component T [Syntrophorhabdaceae bacterium]|nr:energy-coupling factor transporter transmembrane component T [Syntrophorhabdaceae bacterium]
MKYLAKNTFFHRLDPRTKVLLSIGSASLIVLLNEPLSLLLLFMLIFFCFVTVTPPGSYIKITLRMLAVIVIATMVSQGFFYYFEPRTPLITFLSKRSGFIGRFTGGISVYKEGLIYGAIQSMRLSSATVLSMVIVMSTHPSDMVLGLRKLGVPEKIAFMLMVSMRFLPVLIEEAKRIIIAQRLRGLRCKGISGSFKSFRYLVVPLIIDSLRQARRISIAAEVRGFTGRRSASKELRFAWLDYSMLCAFVLIIGTALIYRFYR